MPSFLSLNLTAKHWRIMHALNDAPNGVLHQSAIQAHFGPSAMMEAMEQLYESGWIENTMRAIAVGRPPVRNNHEFRLSLNGAMEYARRRATSPQAKEAEQPIQEAPTATEEPAPRGRPPGAKNQPKAETANR